MKPETLAALRSALWFLLKLNLLAIPLYLVVYFGYSVPQFQDLWALALARSIESLGYSTAVDGNIIGVQSGNTIQQIDLSWDSTGWKSLYVLAALVFASSGALIGKLRFIVFGLPLVALVNFLRIDSTVLVSLEYGVEYFPIVHDFLWSSLMIVFVVALWYFLWLKEKG